MKAAFYDAYGTLFDVHSAVRARAEVIGPQAERLSLLWRDKQLEYSWVHALMEDYVDFHELTRRALRFAISDCAVDAVHEAPLMEAYQTLDAYPEIAAHLAQRKADGVVTGILSNGSPAMLRAAVGSAGIGSQLDHVLSVDRIGTFKTRAETYAMVMEATNLSSPADIVFHSSNRWDVAGAARFGFQTTWVNRTGRPDEYPDHRPSRIVASLEEA